jgi:hypothetical protein
MTEVAAEERDEKKKALCDAMHRWLRRENAS